MLPTPAKFHYIFNLRDLSRIWEGILCVNSTTIKTTDDVVALWKHECLRVISDRFTEVSDREWFEEAITRVVNEDLPQAVAMSLPESPYFVDFMRDAPEATGAEDEPDEIEAPKIYESVS